MCPGPQKTMAFPCTVPIRGAAAVRLRVAEFDDYAKIADLQRRNGLASRGLESWRALWNGNPAYRAGEPIGWILENERGEAGGYIGNLPLEYELDGRVIRAATPYSWAVDAAHRGYSLLLLDRLVKQPGIDLVVCATSNAVAGK